MSKPLIHAESSVKKWGGKVDDYIEIHNLLDSSKAVIADHRHRALTHNTWFLFILEKIFGSYITNSSKKKVSVRDIGERHILEDFGGKFIPSAHDWLNCIDYKSWMNNGKGFLEDDYADKLKEFFKSPPKTDEIVYDGSKLID